MTFTHVTNPVTSLEINVTIRDIKVAYNNVEKWAKPEKPSFSMTFFPMRPVIYKVPKGVVLIMGPFNYPLWEIVPPLVRAAMHT
jgi:aldehyde dehydrogenase (NAD+)